MSDLAGKRLGDFHIDALVGRGSMAWVYKAWQTSLRRPVALKVLKEEIFTPGDRVKRFLREAEALARLEHPHIVPVYAAGEAVPYYYFAMRYVGGGTLAEAMQQGIEQARALEWIRQVCRALAYAHEAGVVHRDLKPTNVLIQGDSALLADFGLARLRDLSTLTQSGMVLGTPLYMAPEQTLGEAISPATDCFALGVLCYQILTGEHPFADLRKTRPSPRDQTELFDRIQRAEARAPRELDPGIPSQLESLVMKALARRPADRFATANELLQAMDALEGLFSASGRVVKSLPAEAHRKEPEPERALPILHAETQELPLSAAGDPRRAGKSTFCFGRYELMGELGHGGQGVVYRARDTILGREVALKVLQGGWKASPRLVELFRREAQIAAGLSHPHIIQVLDFGLEDESPYVTMPVIEGLSLDRLIARSGPLPLGFSLGVLLQAAEALAYAHDAGVLHLDVKPGNILLQRPHRKRAQPQGQALDGLAPPHVVLTDFTMAKLRKQPEHADSSFITSGTVPYASPEQLTNDISQLSPASDLFSLGVILHEMLTGKRLFSGDDPSVDKMLVLHASIPPPSAKAPAVPPELDALCLRLLRRAPGERFESADSLIESAESLGLSR